MRRRYALSLSVTVGVRYFLLCCIFPCLLLVLSCLLAGFPRVSHRVTLPHVAYFSLQHPSAGVRPSCVVLPRLICLVPPCFWTLLVVFVLAILPLWTRLALIGLLIWFRPLPALIPPEPVCFCLLIAELNLDSKTLVLVFPAQAAYNKLLLHNWANSYKCACLPHNTTMQAYTLMYTLIL